MVLCIVVGCSSRSGRDKDVSFFRIPVVRRGRSDRELQLSKARRDGYLAAISREDMTESKLKNERICSKHFVSGRPPDLFNELNPDWLPTQNLGHSKTRTITASREDRYRRTRAKAARRRDKTTDCEVVGDSTEGDMLEERLTLFDKEVQTAENGEEMDQLREELSQAYSTIHMLRDKVEKCADFSQAFMQRSPDDLIQHYTGLRNFQVLKAVFSYVCPEQQSTTKLSPFQEFMLVLLKLRLNSSSQDLSYRFGVAESTVSRILLKWLTLLDSELQPLILWPDRQSLRKTMPDCFSASFGDKVAIIIDCFECFIERPSSLLARASTWSQYKHHNTVKFLIGIAPQGVITYISDAWGGRVSDKYLTEHCGILKKILPGDIVLADRGFDISDSIGAMQAKLHIPAFTKGKDQLSALEVEETRSIANVRIHVERVIGCVRQKYTILQATLPIHFVAKRSGELCPLIDRIARVCCALCNVCDSVVPFN